MREDKEYKIRLLINIIIIALTIISFHMFNSKVDVIQEDETDVVEDETDVVEDETDVVEGETDVVEGKLMDYNRYGSEEYIDILLTTKSINGDTLDKLDYSGNSLIVVSWTSWCKACIEELPEIEKLHSSKSDGVKVITINIGETKEDIESVLTDNNYTFEVLVDENKETKEKLGIHSVPTTYFINKDRTNIKSYTGALNVEQLIEYSNQNK